MANKSPILQINFEDANNPKFEFLGWRAGISLGHVERAMELAIRAAQVEQAKMVQAARRAESVAEEIAAMGKVPATTKE